MVEVAGLTLRGDPDPPRHRQLARPVAYVLGSPVAGRLDAVGEQVDQDWLGRRTVAGTGEAGGFAEWAVAAVADLFPVPDAQVLPDATALHSDGRRCWAWSRTPGPPQASGCWVEAAGRWGGQPAGATRPSRGRQGHRRGRWIAEARPGQELGAEVVAGYIQPGWNEEVLHATGGSDADVRPARRSDRARVRSDEPWRPVTGRRSRGREPHRRGQAPAAPEKKNDPLSTNRGGRRRTMISRTGPRCSPRSPSRSGWRRSSPCR